jgi:hypothetical protein
MATRVDISPELVRQLLRHDPATGDLFWLPRPPEMFTSNRGFRVWNAQNAGKPAFNFIVNGYRMGNIFRQRYVAHRVIWAIVHGEWPTSELDHINGDRADNRLANLRQVSVSTNRRNMARPSTNTSGTGGVSWHKRDRRWRAYVKTGGVNRSLGYFATKEEAVAARKAFNAEHGFTERHGS